MQLVSFYSFKRSSLQAQIREFNQPRFGICPVCTTLGAAGLVAGAAGIRFIKQRLTPIVGEDLAKQVEEKLITLNQQKAGFLDKFKGQRGMDDKELMNALGQDLINKLTPLVEKYYRKKPSS